MKSSWAILLLMILCFSVRAEVEVAETADDVQTFLETNKDNTVALFFIDTSHSEGTEGGFWKGIVTSVSHIFSGEEGAEGSQQKAATIEKALANDADLMKIDVSNEDLEEVMDTFDVQTVPYIIVIKKGVVVLKEVPTHETHDKILQILNVNPAPVHAEPTSEEAASATPASTESTPEPVATETPTEEPTPHTIEVEEESAVQESPKEEDKSLVTKAKDFVGSIFGSDKEETSKEDQAPPAEEDQAPPAEEDQAPPAEEDQAPPAEEDEAPPAEEDEAPPAEEATQTVAVAPQPNQQPKDRPAYPQTRTEPTKDSDMVSASDTRKKWVHHQCHELNTYEDEKASHWRDTPFYISELEDSELPEEWWKNGYKPIKTNSTERMNRVFQGPQTAVPGAKEAITVVPAEPVVIVAPVERFEPYHVHRPEPVMIAEPFLRPEPVIVAEPHYRPQPVVVAEPHYRPQPVVVAEPHYRSRTVAAPQKPTTNTTATTSGRTKTRTTTGAPSAPKQVSMREVTGQVPTQTTSPSTTRRTSSSGPSTRPTTTTRPSTTTRPATTSTRPATTSTRPASAGSGSRTSSGPKPSASSTTVKPTSSSRR